MCELRNNCKGKTRVRGGEGKGGEVHAYIQGGEINEREEGEV